MAYDADGATWIRTEQFGDRKDQVIVRSTGEYAYLLPDLAYHRDKLARGFDLLVDVWGADHHGYVPSMKAGLRCLGHDPDMLEIVLGQLVTLARHGQEVRLSKRAGDIVALSDLLDAVGPDVARLTFLLQSIDTRQTIDLDVITSQSMENPVYYAQYAHARICSIGRVAAERGITRDALTDVDLAALTHERELDVLRALAELPDVVLEACHDRAPHKVTTWARELAGAFHRFHHDCQVLPSPERPIDAALTQARLWLVEAARVGLGIASELLGVSLPESM
jgi:arginyl-tRNA synthetase